MITEEELLDDKVVQGLPTSDGVLLNQVRKAYADHNSELIPNEMFNSAYCSAFLTSSWFTDGTALARAFTILGTHGSFDAEEVANCTKTMNEMMNDVRVAVGRERVPVIYVHATNPSMAEDMLEEVADEVGMLAVFDIKRLHREKTDGQAESHATCKHDEPPVLLDDVASVNDEATVVRGEWSY